MSTTVWAATVRLDLSWTVTNVPTIPPTDYRVEELVSGVWTAVTTVPASQLTFSIPGRAVGPMYSFRIVPVKSGVDGTASNVSVCGIQPPDTVTSLTCTPVLVP
jgi:hypothetical protein